MICIALLLFASCQKEDVELSREKFLGSWRAVNVVTNQEVSTSISEGSKDNLIVWSIAGETIELEFIHTNDTMAFQTNFSVPIFADNSASIKFINKDSLYGIRTIGSIFIPAYRTTQYYLTR